VNPQDKFELVCKHVIENLVVERMDQNEEVCVQFMNDRPFQQVVTALVEVLGDAHESQTPLKWWYRLGWVA